MTTDRGTLASRGRSSSPHVHGLPHYSKWYPGKRDHSPHFSPDRITRHASPSQRSLDWDQEEIVPRIPQPYRTSFSAITSPQRIPKTPPPSSNRVHGVLALTRATPARSTMPGRITNVHAANVISSPPKKPPRTFAYSASSQPANTVTMNGLHSTHLPQVSTKHVVANSVPKPPRSCDQYNAPPGELTIDARMDSVTSTVDSVFSDSYVTDPDSTGDNTVVTTVTDGHQPPHRPPFHYPEPSDPNKKLIIEKEYLHVIEVNPANDNKEKQPMKTEKSSRKGVRNIFKSRKKEKSKNSKAKSEPTSPQLVHKDGHSSTVGSEVSAKDGIQPKVRKSLSSSITKLFKRMSPKSLRRPGDNKAEPSSQTSSCSGSLHGEVLIYQTGEAGSVHSNQSEETSGVVSSPKDSPASQQRVNEDAVGLPSSSARILKSIGDNSMASNDKSVYRAFKDKQSPRTPVEVHPFKPQALRAMEFPDSLLQQAADSHTVCSPGGATSHTVCSPGGATSMTPQTSSSVSPVSPQIILQTVGVGQLGDPPGTIGTQWADPSRRQDPPNTLNVRDVSKLNRRMFAFPSMSAESIGQCSLDVMGSEPSLASKNGQRSSTASKRTLASQENITAASMKSQLAQSSASEELTRRSASQSSLPPVETTLPGTDMVDNSGSPKTPSYLKLSCALGGYNQYSSYASPKAPNRVRVQEGGSVDGDLADENLIPNGHVDLDLVTSKKGSRGPTPAMVKITQNGAIVTRLSNGSVEYPPIQPKPVNYRTSVSDTEADHTSVVNGHTADSECNATNTDSHVKHDQENKPEPVEVFSTPQQNRDSDSDTLTPSKDGKYFQSVVDREEARLLALCETAETYLRNNNIPEEAGGKLRATIGKAHLLTNKKFNQFRGLCKCNIEQDSDEEFQTTCQDLAGFWDMVLIQVDDIARMFADIDRLRLNNWQEQCTTPVQAKKSVGSSSSAKSRSARSRVGATTPKSSKSQEAAKARDEARRRLMAAKRAGRERKASQSDKEEVEIYVN